MRFKPLAAAAAVVFHLVIVASVLRQSLDLRGHPNEPRFLTWQLYLDSTYYNGPGIDFFAVYHAGINDRTAVSPYVTYERFGGVTPYFFDFRYLPVVGSTLGRTMTLLPPLAAYRAWVLTTEVSFWCVALVVLRGLGRRTAGFVGWLALVAGTPFFLEIHMGQFTFVTAALLATALWLGELGSTRRSRLVFRVVAGVTSAAAVLLKLFPAVALFAWVRRRTWWFPLAFAATIVGLLTVPTFVAQPRLWDEFLSANAIAPPNPGNFGALYVFNLAGGHLGYAWSQEGWRQVVRVGLVFFVGSAGLAVFLARRRALYAETAVLLLAQFLASFQVWEHHMSAAIVAGALLLLEIERQAALSEQASSGSGRFDRVCAWIAAACLVVLALPTPYVLVGPDLRSWTFLERMAVQVTKPVPTLLLYLTGLVWLSREGFGWPGVAASDSSGAASVR